MCLGDVYVGLTDDLDGGQVVGFTARGYSQFLLVDNSDMSAKVRLFGLKGKPKCRCVRDDTHLLGHCTYVMVRHLHRHPPDRNAPCA